MNGEIFYWVLNMSIAGTVVGTVVWLLQRVLHLSKRLTFVLWIVPLVRLWLPFGVESKYSLMGLIRKVTVRPVKYMEVLPPINIQTSMMNTIGVAESYFPIVYKQNVYRTIFGTAEAIWLIVALAAVLAGVAIYLSTAAELKSAKRIKDHIYRSDKVTSPMVFGVIRPRILLPEIPAVGAAGDSMEIFGAEDEQSYVLLHEQTHIRRMDNLWRVIAVLTCCLHWFNPLIWLFLKQFLADMELACDEKVISICGEERRKEYASALLDYEEQKTLFASAFGGAGIRVRIKQILSYRRLTVFSTIGFLVLLAVVVITLLTNATG